MSVRRLKIGMFTYSCSPRGSVVCAASLSEALTRQGHDVTLFALSKDESAFYRTLEAKLCLVPAAAAPKETSALVKQRVLELGSYIRTRKRSVHFRKFDIFHGQDCLVTSALLDTRDIHQTPIVRTLHHVEHFENPYLRACQERSLRRADQIIVVSRQSSRELNAHFGLGATRIENGVDVEWLGGSIKQGNEQNSLLRLPGGDSEKQDGSNVQERRVVVLSVGGIEERKNTIGALRGFALFRKTYPNAEWFVVGGSSVLDHGAYNARFFEALNQYPAELRRAVHVLGVVEQQALANLYARADVLLHPSVQEGFGLCVLEAMASGTPVLVSRKAPFTDYLDKRCAVFAAPESPEEVSAGLAQAVRNRGTLVPQARVRAAEFSWQTSAERHVGAYRELLSRFKAKYPTHLGAPHA